MKTQILVKRRKCTILGFSVNDCVWPNLVSLYNAQGRLSCEVERLNCSPSVKDVRFILTNCFSATTDLNKFLMVICYPLSFR